MRLVALTRVIGEMRIKVSINPDYVVWVQPCRQGTTLYMEAGPDIEVVESYDAVVKVLQGDDA
jgi:hypothetical protein